MKISCGTDIEKISRFEKYTRNDFKKLLKIFTASELEYCFSKINSAPHLCVRFCAKEAVVKALCTYGFEKPSLNKIEVIKDGDIPRIAILTKLLSRKHCSDAESLNISVSLSHCGDYACVNVVIY